MAFYKASEKFGMECMQLTPAFDIDLFAEPDNEEYNMVGDEMENPFFGTAPAGTQQMTLVSGYNWPTYVSFSSYQRNLIKTFQIKGMIALITKITLIFSSDLLNGQK